MSQAYLSDFLAAKRGLGQKLIDGVVARYPEISSDELQGRPSKGVPPMGRHPDWKRARAAAGELRPEIPASVLDEVARAAIPGLPETIDGDYVAGMASEILGVRARAALKRPARSGSDK